MMNLEELPKKNPFEVPDGYFDDLPQRIQAKTSSRSRPALFPSGSSAWQFALPVVLLTTVGIFWYQSHTNTYPAGQGVQTELEKIQPGQLAVYLNDRDLTTDDLVEAVAWSTDDIHELENSVYSSMEVSNDDIEKLIEEYDEL